MRGLHTLFGATVVLTVVGVQVEGPQVTTLAQNRGINDGMFVDEDGFIYTTGGGLMQQTTIGRVTPDGEYATFQEGFSGPIDITRDRQGVFFVTNYDDNTVKRYDPSTGTITNVASGLDGPAGIEIDQQGTLYVTCFGAPPAYAGHEIVRILPDGTVETFLSSDALERPQGMTFDDDGFLYVSNTPNGRVFKIDTNTGQMTPFADLGVNVGNLAYRKGKIYVAGNRTHKLYTIDLEGRVEEFAGTGQPGQKDGPLASAEFLRPLGIAFTADGGIMYVAQAGNGALRKIVMPDRTDL